MVAPFISISSSLKYFDRSKEELHHMIFSLLPRRPVVKRNITRAFELKGVVKCFLSAMIGVTIFTMKRNGPDYVDQPKYISILKSSNLYF